MTLLPEDYLGEGVDSFSQFKHKKEFYGIRSYSDTLSKHYFGKEITSITVSTDMKDIIYAVDIYPKEYLDGNFLNQLIKVYGLPDLIQKRKVIKSIETNENDFMKFEKIQYNIINCQLDEKPNEIKWTKLGFDIIVHPEGLNGNGTIGFITTK